MIHADSLPLSFRMASYIMIKYQMSTNLALGICARLLIIESIAIMTV